MENMHERTALCQNKAINMPWNSSSILFLWKYLCTVRQPGSTCDQGRTGSKYTIEFKQHTIFVEISLHCEKPRVKLTCNQGRTGTKLFNGQISTQGWQMSGPHTPINMSRLHAFKWIFFSYILGFKFTDASPRIRKFNDSTESIKELFDSNQKIHLFLIVSWKSTDCGIDGVPVS